ncbi:unnamed protein product, partial [marine sediment metagenome]
NKLINNKRANNKKKIKEEVKKNLLIRKSYIHQNRSIGKCLKN